MAGGESRINAVPAIRALIETVIVGDDPASPDQASIEVTGSLDTVLAIAKGTLVPASTKGRTVPMVAKETTTKYLIQD